MKTLAVSLFLIISGTAQAAEIDCSEAYGTNPAKCEHIVCDAKYLSFLGEWKGPFSTYVRELSAGDKNVFRPFKNTVTYSESDCLKRPDTGDTFIIGRRTDAYPSFKSLPAKTVHGLLITGKKADGSPFLRTVDEEGANDYTLIYQNKAANMSIWSLTVPAGAKSAEMRFTVIDGQDFSEVKAPKRNVTVTMSVGPAETPYWEGVVSSGYHSLKK
jgi:hypothetical protein